MPELITREEVISFIKSWADTHPGKDNIIKNSLGSGGTAWHDDYKDGVISMIDGLVRTVNEKVRQKMLEQRNALAEFRNKEELIRNVLRHWETAIDVSVNDLINRLKAHLGTNIPPLRLDNNGKIPSESLPEIPEI